MKKIKLPANISRTVSNITFQLKKHSPEILLGLGLVSGVAGAVVACKATTKVQGVLAQAKEDIEFIHESVEKKAIIDPETGLAVADYSEEDGKKDTTIVYAKTGVEIAKLYAPAVALGGVAVLSILGSYNIVNKRYIAAAAAYTSVSTTFNNYRKNTVERFGEKVDHELRYGIKPVEVEETVVDEKGKEKKVKKTVNTVSQLDLYSDYARFFDCGNPNWEKDPEYNKMFLRAQQNYANDLLRVNGRVFLNDVYKMLGFEPTKAGQIVGWRYDPKHPKADSFIDFGIMDINKTGSRDFINGLEPAILLDFNVDGNVWDDMPESRFIEN